MARVTECDRDRTGAAPARAGGRDRDAVLYPFPALGCGPGGARDMSVLGSGEQGALGVGRGVQGGRLSSAQRPAGAGSGMGRRT